MKKLVSLLLAAAMLLGMTGTVLAEEKVELTAFQWALDNQICDFNTLWYFQQIEEQTGVHVTFEPIKEPEWQTKLNLMMAVPEEMTDLIIRGPVDVEEYGVTQGLLLPLDEYLTEEIMPNYMSRINLNNAGDSIPSSDGKSYSIGYLIAQNVNHESTSYINMSLLEELNLAVPTTIDEYTEVLRAFKAHGVKYPYAGSIDEYGPQSIWALFASFGVPLTQRILAYIGEGDQVGFIGDLPGFRSACEWMHTLYSEGLMDPESLTQDSNLWANKVNAGEVASFNYLRLINTALTPEAYADFKSILPPAAEGYKVAVPAILEVPESGAYLTSINKDPVASLKWIDAQLDTEMMMTASNGKLGDTMKINDEGKYEIIYVPENNGLYDIVPVTMGQFFAPGDYYTSIYQMAPHRVERYQDSLTYAEAGVLEHKSYDYLYKLSKMNSEDSIEASNLFTELQKFLNESLIDFVKNGVSDEAYQQFLDTAKAIGSERYVELYQNAYNAYLSK